MTALAAEIREHMTTLADWDDAPACDDCGEPVAQAWHDAHEGYCPRCHHRAQAEAARDELIEAREDLASLLDELADLRERIAEGKERIGTAKAAVAALKGRNR